MKPNPTMVHHGLAKKARFHLWAKSRATGKPVALADLYTSRAHARKIGQELASRLNGTVYVSPNPPHLPSFCYHQSHKATVRRAANPKRPNARRKRTLSRAHGTPTRRPPLGRTAGRVRSRRKGNPRAQKFTVKVGDRVQYTAAFLKSAGLHVGPYGFLKGTVLELKPYSLRLVRKGDTQGHRTNRKGRKRGVTRAKKNPRGEVARAKQTARMWNEFTPTRARKIKGPPRRIPKTLVKLGELHSVTYASNKYAGGKDNPTGKPILYEHTTQRPRPVLATDPSGRHVHIVGGKMKPTADGLVN